MDKLTNLLGFFAALTLATERITESFKGLPFLSRWLAVEKPAGSTAEEFRKASIHLLAAGVAAVLSFALRDQISGFTGMQYRGIWTPLFFGAMASGGSGMWNSLLDIVSELNHQKQLATQQLKSNPAAALPQVPVLTRPPAAPVTPTGARNQPVAAMLPKLPEAATPAPGAISQAGATGDQLVQLARRHLGEKYVLGVRVPKDDGNWTGPWNCSEFASWLIFQIARILYGCDNDTTNPAIAHGFTGYWNRDAETKGRITSIEQAAATPGAAVLRLPQPGATGHIVICDGENGTIEAHSANDGVIASTLNGRRWDLAILVPGITYAEGPLIRISPPRTTIYRLRQPMMTGDKVREIQEKLKAAGLDPGPLDGEFGPYTHTAVVAFQVSHGLLCDGEVGHQTAAALGVSL